MIRFKKVYNTCACGRRTNTDVCWVCRSRASFISPHLGRRHGKSQPASTGISVCKMPKCRKTYRLAADQDRRYTWYCPDCRRKIAEITTGVIWLGNLGIDIAVGNDGEDILMDSTVQAYNMAEEDGDETILLQRKKTLVRDGAEDGGVPERPHGGKTSISAIEWSYQHTQKSLRIKEARAARPCHHG